ncbi:Uncharacterised protein [Serratia proteamaculans]|uniref:hypothetical protein n=1 Tax=Serratia proteamaculans TaxID=28151 RepID=UPI0021839170|nr:hypothetical protein [Serratia proteamaculans]CAI2399217.1 Uncharacterised protein [Serratia proteamaculans]
MKQNPFSFYDFLGYLIPGAALLYFIYFGGILYHFEPVESFYSYIIVDNGGLLELLKFIPSVVFSYITGHFISLLSSFAVEKYCTRRNGYPSQFIFQEEGERSRVNVITVNLPLSKRKVFLPFTNIHHLVTLVVILPIALIEMLPFGMLNQVKPIPQPLRNTVFLSCKKILKKKFKVDVSSMDVKNGLVGDSFRIVYHYAYEYSERHALKLQNYVALYGFSRNISFVFVVIFWIMMTCKVFYLYGLTHTLNFHWFLIITTAIISYVFYQGFVKFYRRYTLEAIMAVCVIDANK